MKLDVINTKAQKSGSLELPLPEGAVVDTGLINRAVIAYYSELRQPYGADPRAGLKHSTRISKRRRKYRGSYGKGISRVPRKILSARGLHFYWVGAQAPGTVGGRRAHPPKAEKIWVRKINKKERNKAILSALTAAFDKSFVQQRGHVVPDNYPFLLSDDFESLNKTKDFMSALKALGFEADIKRGLRGGKSLLIVADSENLRRSARNIPGVDVASPSEINAYLLAPGAHPGRATLFTVSAAKKFFKLEEVAS